jgi:hypothetical protein
MIEQFRGDMSKSLITSLGGLDSRSQIRHKQQTIIGSAN